MKGLIKEGTRPYGYQRWVPVAFRKHFGGKKKHSVSLDTHDHDEAVRRANVAARDFDARCGIGDGPMFDLAAIAGVLFNAVMNRNEMVDIEECVSFQIASLQEEGHLLVDGMPTGGPTFDKLVRILDRMCTDAEARYNPSHPRVRKVGRTLAEQAEAWRKLPSPLTDKTRDQYVKDVIDFTLWYQSTVRKGAVGAGITRKEVNAYVESRMAAKEPKNTIMRRLSGLMKIYKSGQFSDDNPFSRVTDRIDITGPVLEVRSFADEEMLLIFKEAKEFDQNVQMSTRLAAFTGFRISELCRLTVGDLKSVKNGKELIWYLDYSKGKDRKAKTPSSYRMVPVHPGLISDLKKFIKGRPARAFLIPEESVDKYGARSGAISKRMNRLIDYVTLDREAREHSFRHTVITKLADAGVPQEVRKALAGHKGSDPHDGYNHAKRIRELYEAVKLISYQ